MSPEESLQNVEYQKSSNLLVKARIYWIDYAKGIGIFLVVLGHTLRGLINASILEPSAVTTFVDKWIYTFHMPLFFLISGLFTEQRASNTLRKFFLEKVKTIVYPYFLWSIIQSLLQLLADSNHKGGSLNDIWKIIYSPVMQFWFLYVLFIIVIIYKLIYFSKNSNLYFLLISILLYLTHIFNVNLGGWGIVYQVRINIIYFAIGIMISNFNLLWFLSKLSLSKLIMITVTGYLAIALGVFLNFTEYQPTFPIFALIGISSSLALSIILEKFKIAELIKVWGILSLQIYVAHSIASALMRIMLQKIFHFSEPFIHLALGTAIGIYLPIYLNRLCKGVGFKYMFTLRPS